MKPEKKDKKNWEINRDLKKELVALENEYHAITNIISESDIDIDEWEHLMQIRNHTSIKISNIKRKLQCYKTTGKTQGILTPIEQRAFRI